MFFDIFSDLCNKKGVTLNKACVDCGVSRTSVAKWKKGAIPNGTTLAKFAEYFNVSTDYLLGSGKENGPASHSENEAEQLQGVYLRLAKGAQELGLDDEDVDTILALYAKHRRNNHQ